MNADDFKLKDDDQIEELFWDLDDSTIFTCNQDVVDYIKEILTRWDEMRDQNSEHEEEVLTLRDVIVTIKDSIENSDLAGLIEEAKNEASSMEENARDLASQAESIWSSCDRAEDEIGSLLSTIEEYI